MSRKLLWVRVFLLPLFTWPPLGYPGDCNAMKRSSACSSFCGLLVLGPSRFCIALVLLFSLKLIAKPSTKVCDLLADVSLLPPLSLAFRLAEFFSSSVCGFFLFVSSPFWPFAISL